MRNANFSKDDALVERINNESVSTSFFKTITNTVISVFVVVMFLMIGTKLYSQPPYSGGGSGTSSSPWVILNLQDWNRFANDITGSVIPNGGLGKYFKLMADIGTQANPVRRMVGDEYNPFCGNFDGGNHTVWVNFRSIGGVGTAAAGFVGLFPRTSNYNFHLFYVRQEF